MGKCRSASASSAAHCNANFVVSEKGISFLACAAKTPRPSLSRDMNWSDVSVGVRGAVGFAPNRANRSGEAQTIPPRRSSDEMESPCRCTVLARAKKRANLASSVNRSNIVGAPLPMRTNEPIAEDTSRGVPEKPSRVAVKNWPQLLCIRSFLTRSSASPRVEAIPLPSIVLSEKLSQLQIDKTSNSHSQRWIRSREIFRMSGWQEHPILIANVIRPCEQQPERPLIIPDLNSIPLRLAPWSMFAPV